MTPIYLQHEQNTYISFQTWVQLLLAQYSCGPFSYMCDVYDRKNMHTFKTNTVVLLFIQMLHESNLSRMM